MLPLARFLSRKNGVVFRHVANRILFLSSRNAFCVAADSNFLSLVKQERDRMDRFLSLSSSLLEAECSG